MAVLALQCSTAGGHRPAGGTWIQQLGRSNHEGNFCPCHASPLALSSPGRRSPTGWRHLDTTAGRTVSSALPALACPTAASAFSSWPACTATLATCCLRRCGEVWGLWRVGFSLPQWWRSYGPHMTYTCLILELAAEPCLRPRCAVWQDSGPA
eukprot:360976-Chlamydomonas_euryale.AAC.7